MMNIRTFITQQEGRLNLFLPFCFACGIVFYFMLPFEPALWVGLSAFILFFLSFLLIKSNIRLLLLAGVFFFGGFLRVNIETIRVKEPFLHKKYSYVSVVGKIEELKKYPNAQKVVLTNLKLDKIPKSDYPIKITVRINGTKTALNIGDVISLKATLMPPTLPYLPDGYPYSRMAFYNQIGATGYATSKINIVSRAQQNESFLKSIRLFIRKTIERTLPKEQASVATALTTGDQALITNAQRELYTTAGIVHILSVSGFHMTMIAGFIFFILRWLFMFFPRFSSMHNTKKICAVFALIATFFYLLISGMAIPAVRSFGMVVLILTGVLFDRKAVSLHSVFWIGFLILLFSPQAIMTASFALSFSAVIALVASYEMFYSKLLTYFNTKSFFIKYVLFPVVLIILMNFIAHIATAPVVIYHFHRYANYTIIGNFLTAPVFSLLIMPLLFCAMVLMPFGLSYPLLWTAGCLLYCMDMICKWLANLPLANLYLPPLSDFGYAIFMFASVIFFLLKGRIRFVLLPFMAFGALTFLFYQKPDVLINQGGHLWAVNNKNDTIYSSLTKYKRTRYAWQEIFGKAQRKDDSVIQNVKGLVIRFDGVQDEKADIIFNTKQNDLCKAKACISRKKLWKEGTHAVYIKDGKFKIKSVADEMKDRPWCQ
ncbi:MAG: ComEC/Rec2 family competence protein [Alphaproteobacteria bacterium]